MNWVRFTYFILTLITCGQVMFRGPFMTGAAALLAAALCFFSVAGIVGSVRARRENKYSQRDLAIIGAIALGLCAAGFALMAWSEFSITLFGTTLSGVVWAIIGVALAAITTTNKDALPETTS
jgi:hypothetical protein